MSITSGGISDNLYYPDLTLVKNSTEMETILDREMVGNDSDIGTILPASAGNISPCVFNATMFHSYIKGMYSTC